MVNIVTIIYRVSYVSSDVGFQPSTVGVAFKYFFFHPYLGKWSKLTHIFQMGWNHQLEKNSRKQLLTPVLYKPGTGARWTCPRKSGTLMQQLVQFGSWDLSGARGWQFLKRGKQWCKMLQYPFRFHFLNFLLLSNDCFSCFIYIQSVALHEISVENIAVRCCWTSINIQRATSS